MNKQNNSKLSIQTFLSIVGVAGASVLMSFPAFAQMTPSNSGSSTETPQMTGDRKPTDDRSMQNQTQGSQQMDGTSNTSDRQMNSGSTTVETQQYNRSTTTQQTNPNGTPATTPTNTPAVTPTDTAPMSTPENTTSPSTGATQQAPDQGVRALW